MIGISERDFSRGIRWCNSWAQHFCHRTNPRALLCGRILTFVYFNSIYVLWTFSFVLNASGATHCPLGGDLGDLGCHWEYRGQGVFGLHSRIFQIVNIVKIKNDRHLWDGFFDRNSMVQFLGSTCLTQKKARALLCGRILTFVYFNCIYAFWMFHLF